MRVHAIGAALGVLALVACASRRARQQDPVHRAMAVVSGFHDASPTVAELLGDAAGWAVFPNAVLDGSVDERTGLLFTPDHRTSPVVLRGTAGAPIDVPRHVLVVLGDESDVAHIGSATLSLDGAVHLLPHDDHVVAPSAARIWIVSSALSGLLFEPDESTGGWALSTPDR